MSRNLLSVIALSYALLLAGCEKTPSPPADNQPAASSSTLTPLALGVNLARDPAATAAASSYEDGSNVGPYRARMAIDGDGLTRWASLHRMDNQWLRVNLGSVKDIGTVVVKWERAYATKYRIDVSTDGTAWTTLKTLTKTDNAAPDVIKLPAGTRAKYVRVYGLTRALADYGYSIYELEVYAPDTLPSGPTTLISGNKRASASTSDNSGALPANALDGNAGTRWASGVTPMAWYMVDLGAAARIDRVEIDWERAVSSKYTIEVSNDAKTWTAASAVQTNPKVVDGRDPALPDSELKDAVPISLSQAYRYVRINSTERGWSDYMYGQYGVSAWEVRVYGAGGQDNPPAPVEPASPTGTYALKWSDEFDSAATPARVDTAKWNYELGDGCPNLCNWGNNEREYYTDSLSNVFMQNGLLNITARKNDQNHPYTSGRITTQNKYQFTYGKIAARIRMQMPSTASGVKDGPVGVWGAFWMLGYDVNDPYSQWPNSGELDIMENIGYSWWHSSSLHGPGYYAGGSIGASYNKKDTDTGITDDGHPTFTVTDWHTYQAEWDSNQVVFSIDDVPYRTVTRSEVEARGPWVFNKPNFILLNVAYGGGYPGAYLDSAQNFTGAKTADGLAALAENNFPHTMQVDWVRVWQKQ